MQLLPSRAFLALLALLVAAPVMAQTSPVGTWRTFDGRTPRSIVRITEANGVLTGTIVQLLPEGRVCEGCEPYPSDGPVASQRGRATAGTNMRGFVVLSGFSDRDGDGKWTGGKAFKPDDGKIYSGWLQVQPNGTLLLKGGYRIPVIGLVGKEQTWERIR